MESITDEDRLWVFARLADCYYHLEDREAERKYIFKSFECDTPRPPFCCRLAYIFLEKEEYAKAVFWYQLALEVPDANNAWSAQNEVSRTWLPHIQLGLCYFNLGKYEQSYHHNRLALKYRPEDKGIKSNLKLLEELIGPSSKQNAVNREDGGIRSDGKH